MLKKWFVTINEQKVGPLSEREVAEKLKSGLITPATLVWNAEMTTWQPLETTAIPARVEEILATPLVADNTVVATQPRLPSAAASAPATFTPSMAEAQVTPALSARRPAGFWIRVLATLIDNIILSCLLVGVITVVGIALRVQGMAMDQMVDVLQMLNLSISVMSSILYYAVIQTALQGTLGKKVCGLELVQEDGSRMGYLQAFTRYFMMWVATIPFGLGLMAVGWHPKKQGWHDRVAKTMVVYK